MIRIFIFYLAIAAVMPWFKSTGKPRKQIRDQASSSAQSNDKEIRWLTLSELEAAMKTEPRSVWIDFYTSWCGWCKVMDRKTYANPYVIKYMNEHFYSVRLDAEQKTPVVFRGKEYVYLTDQKVNQFAVAMMNGQLTFPTGVFMEKGFGPPIAIPGYQDVGQMELMLRYLNEGAYKTTQLPVYKKGFQPSWK